MSFSSLVPMGDVCTINPRLPNTERPSSDQLVSFVPMSSVDEIEGTVRRVITRPYAEVAKGYTLFRNRNVLFAKITPCMENGKAAMVSDLMGGLGFGSTEFHVLRAGPKIDPGFIFHLVRTPEFRRRAKTQFTGTAGQQRVPSSFLENALVPLPPLAEQRRIVDILDRAASIRRLRRQAQQTARQIIPALFTKMFGDDVPYAASWAKQPLGNLLATVEPAIRTGPFGSQLRHSDFVDSGIPVLAIDNVVSNNFQWTKPRCIPEERLQQFRRFIVRPRDLLITIMGTTGRCAIAPDDLPTCISTKHLCVLTLNEKVIRPEFAWASLLFDPSVRSQIAVTGHGAIMEGWNMGLVKRLALRIPPLSLQDAFIESLRTTQSLAGQQVDAAKREDAVSLSLSSRLLS